MAEQIFALSFLLVACIYAVLSVNARFYRGKRPEDLSHIERKIRAGNASLSQKTFAFFSNLFSSIIAPPVYVIAGIFTLIFYVLTSPFESPFDLKIIGGLIVVIVFAWLLGLRLTKTHSRSNGTQINLDVGVKIDPKVYRIQFLDIVYQPKMENDVIDSVLTVLSKSGRSMPAHFCDNSFIVEWPKLDRVDEYEMASVAWYETEGIDNQNVFSSEELYKLIAAGENFMLGGYILEQLNATDENFENFVQTINQSFLNTGDPQTANRLSNAGKNYFNMCLNYGRERGRK